MQEVKSEAESFTTHRRTYDPQLKCKQLNTDNTIKYIREWPPIGEVGGVWHNVSGFCLGFTGPLECYGWLCHGLE